MIVFGILLLIYGIYDLNTPIQFGCPVNGCPPVTATQRWDFYLPGLISTLLGAGLIVIGTVLVIKGSTATRTFERQNTQHF